MPAAETVSLSDTAETDPVIKGYRELLNEDHGDEITYGSGHKSPDSDAVGSAMAYAYLLNELGIRAEAVIAGPVNSESLADN